MEVPALDRSDPARTPGHTEPLAGAENGAAGVFGNSREVRKPTATGRITCEIFGGRSMISRIVARSLGALAFEVDGGRRCTVKA
jgi:hypothetical protein